MSGLNFKKLHVDALLPSPARDGDAGYDLHCVEAFELAPCARMLVDSGVAVAIPSGFAGLVLPRSGLAVKHGISLVNAPGLIDSGYRGELKVLLLNTDPTETFVGQAGDRIAQLVVVRYEALVPNWAAELDETDRGAGGFGSTGLGPS